MKVVLSQHVEHLGERGEIVSVAPGYARNYLLPNRLALEATPGNLKVIEHQRKIWAVKEAREIGEAEEIAARLASLELTVVKKTGEKESFDREKLSRSLSIALRKRPVDEDRIERIVNGIQRRLETLGENEIPTKVVGEMVMDHLADLDKVAYVRFASVYRNFREAKDFEDFVGKMGDGDD